MANAEQKIMELIPDELKNKLPGFLQGNVLSGVVDKIKQQYPDLYKKVEESEGQIPEDVKQKLTEIINNFVQQKLG